MIPGSTDLKAHGADRRRPARAKLRGNVRGTLGLRGDARLIDLSPRGAMIEHLGRLSPGETCIFELLLADMDLRLGTRIAWSRVHSVGKSPTGESEIRFRSGLHFCDMAEGVETHIRHYLAAPRGPEVDHADEGR